MNRIVRSSLLFSMMFFILVILLTFSGYLSFGHGLGDLGDLAIIFSWIVCIVITYLVTRKMNFNLLKLLSALILFILLASLYYFIRQFTVDRGGEHPWDGRVIVN